MYLKYLKLTIFTIIISELLFLSIMVRVTLVYNFELKNRSDCQGIKGVRHHALSVLLKILRETKYMQIVKKKIIKLNDYKSISPAAPPNRISLDNTASGNQEHTQWPLQPHGGYGYGYPVLEKHVPQRAYNTARSKAKAESESI